MGETIEAIVDGGQASAGPPLGPALGPAGVNIGEVIQAINQKTADYKGMKVPVKVIIDDKKKFEIEVGTPPASALIKEKAGLKSASGNAKTDFVGNISLDDAKAIATMKGDDVLGADLKAKVREVVGTCVSMGITVEGTDPRRFQGELAKGRHDGAF